MKFINVYVGDYKTFEYKTFEYHEKQILYSVCEKLIVRNHGASHCKTFAKENWRVGHVKLFLVKHKMKNFVENQPVKTCSKSEKAG